MNEAMFDEAEEELETFGTDDITCPWCLHVLRDSWKKGESGTVEKCPKCGEGFTWERQVEVVYNTEKILPKSSGVSLSERLSGRLLRVGKHRG